MSIHNCFPSGNRLFPDMNIKHIEMMKVALTEAQSARKKGEVPIGAVLVSHNHQILAAEHNRTITLNDPTAHAEILALRSWQLQIVKYHAICYGRTLSNVHGSCYPCQGFTGDIRYARPQMGSSWFFV
jgi:tRNA(adenine34) deaminase